MRRRALFTQVLVVNTVLLGAVAIAATFYSQHAIVAATEAEAARKVAIREGIGKFIASGNALRAVAEDSAQNAPTSETQKWLDNVEQYLSSNLGQSYVTRFNDSAGMLPVSLAGGAEKQHDYLWKILNARLIRLEQFSEQFPS